MQNISQKQKDNLSAAAHPNWSIASRILLTLLIGVAVGLAVGETGVFALLILPAILVVLIIVLQPDLGLIIFLLVTYLQLSNVLIVFHGFPSIAQPLAALLIVVVAMRVIFHHEWPLKWWTTILVLGLYATAIFVSIFGAGEISVALRAFISLFKDMLGGVLVFFLIRKPSSLRTAVWTLIVAGLIMGSISAFQYLTGTFSNHYWGFGGWVNQVSGGVAQERVTGPYSNPNAYSQVFITILPLALERIWHEKRTILRLVAGFSLIVSVLTLIFTFSRGGFLSALVTLGLFFVLFRPKIMPLFLTIVIMLTILQFIPSGYTDRLSTVFQLSSSDPSLVSDQSFRGRISENTAAWRMFFDHPLIGVGIGNYPVNYQNYSREIGLDNRREARTPASLYLEILSEQGLVGIALFFLLLVNLFRNGNRAYHNFISSGFLTESFLMRALLAGLVGYLVAAIVKNSAYSNVFWALLGIAFGAISLSYSRIENKWKLRGRE